MAKKEYNIVSGDLGAVRLLTTAGYRLQTGRELQDDRCKDGQEELQNDYFYVPDGSVFYRDPKSREISWAHTNGEHNLIILPQYIDRALKELPPTGIFRPDTAQESWDAINHRSTKRFTLDDLGLVKGSEEVYFMPIKTGKFDALSPVQQKAASLVGHTRKNVAYLNKCGISETQIRFQNPKYIAAVLEKYNDPFWRASWLNNFGGNSNANANVRYVNDQYRLRGVRSSSCEPSEPLVVKSPKSAPEIASGVASQTNESVPSVQSALQEVRRATMEEILSLSLDYVPTIVQKDYLAYIRQKIAKK